MSSADNPYRTWGMIAAQADTNERADFIRLTYLHLAGAVAAFAGIEALLLNMPGTSDLVTRMIGGRFSWIIVLALFMGVSWIANSWAMSATSKSTQYAGLVLYVVAEAIIFLPLLYIADHFGGTVLGGFKVIPVAAVLTLIIFGGLTAIVFVTAADFSFLRTALSIAGFAALGIMVCSMFMGFNLGILFTAALIVLACGYILYDTSNVLHHYHIGQHVGASLALFASLALLFWYILRIVMELSSDRR